ncbi:MAG: c-type cytochrome biogenesis protein CcmI [Gammaproteobacteria bacterium]|nr:c-type cytochrome biogenesis protein CcmI [Gammaproteobacteria bacterium]
MTGFAILAFSLMALALAPVLLSLIRQKTGPGTDQRLRAYRARLAEIEHEARDGVIAADQADSVRHEIEREMLAHVGGGAPPTGAAGSRLPLAPISVALFVSLFAIGLYLYAGRPDLIGVDTGATAQPEEAGMIAALSAHLKRHPDDQKGWQMLGRAHMAAGRYPEAVQAYERLYALAGEDADTLVRYADALAMSAGGRLGGKPVELINRALALDQHHRTALWLAGMAAMERGDAPAAVNYWHTLLPLLEDENTKAEVSHLIEQAGGTPAGTAAGAAAGIAVRVEIAPELAREVPAGATVFVSARAQEGPPMPLAVVKRAASELPFDVVLDDSLAMAPELRLSQHAKVTVTARISKSGRAERESGDLIGEVHGIATAGVEPVTLTIHAAVP